MNINHNGSAILQVSEQLEADIRGGGYLPGSKLLSMRTLSEKLRVDRNIIRAALDRLEARGVVTKEARKGVFVSPAVLSGGLPDLYLFSHCSEGTGQTGYVEQALELHRRFDYRRRFNVTLRYSGWNTMSAELLRNELTKVRVANAALLLVSGTLADEERIGILNESGVPFLVVGEIPRDLPRHAFNQVYASCAAKGLDVGEFIVRNPFREVAYFAVPKDMMIYEEDYIDILRNRMEHAGKRLLLKRLKFDRHLQARCSRYYEAAVRELLASGERPDLLHFSDQVDVRAIIRIAGEFGLRVPEDINILTCAQTMLNPVPGIFAVRTDFSKFAAETFDLCGKLAGRNREPEKHNLTHLVSHEILKLDFESILNIYC